MSASDLLLYCERWQRNDPVTVFDVFETAEWKKAADWLDYDESDPRSMVQFMGLECPPYGAPRNGHWYRLPPRELWHRVEPVGNQGRDSLLFRHRLAGRPKIDFRRLRVPPPSQQPTETRPPRLPRPQGPLELEVVGCGQGNWNEVRAPNFRLIYDVGADVRWSGDLVRRLVHRQIGNSKPMETHVVISHWDADHYHALLGFTDAQLSCIRSMTAPPSPQNQTSKRVLTRCREFFPVWELPPAAGDGGRRIVLKKIHSDEWLDWYRGSKGQSRNQTGIVLAVHGKKTTALLTGDHHHPKIREALDGIPFDSMVYVVPHHGGEAGKFDPSAWGTVAERFEAAFSHGNPKRFGHPKRVNENAAIALCGSTHSVFHTDGHRSRSWPLCT